MNRTEPMNDETPPAIPQKVKKPTTERQPSPYDNVPEEKIGMFLLHTIILFVY